MNVQSKEFWLKVKEEYIKSNTVHICDGSKTFNKQWHIVCKQYIKEQAFNFLDTQTTSFRLGVLNCLFSNFFKTSKMQQIQIRKDFINHMINKYS